MRLDDRVTVLQESESKDGYGEETATYSDGEAVWANVDLGSPRERRANGVTEEQAQVIVTLRDSTAEEHGLARDSRLTYGGDTLHVNGVRDQERDGFTELTCTRTRT